MRRLAFLIVLLAAAPVTAQTVSGDRFTLNTGPCTMRSGLGQPSAALGKTCDTYVDTGSGDFWMRLSTGWTRPGGIGGSGTVGRSAKWLTTSTLGDARVYDDGTNLMLDPTGDLYLAPAGRDVFPQQPYAINLGSPPNKFLTLHVSESWSETLVALDKLATIGGRVLVGPTTTLTRDLNATDTTIYVKHNNLENQNTGVRYGSELFLESAGKFEQMYVNGTSSPQQGDGSYAYTVIRNRDGSGGDQWFAGDAVFSTGGINYDGTNAAGFIDLYSVRGLTTGFGPTIVGNVRNIGTIYEPRFAIGNLNGLYGYGENIYGAVFGKPNGARLTVDATNGVHLYDGNNQPRVSLFPNGSAFFAGDGSGVTNINGGNITTGTVNTNRLAAGNSRNQLPNSECRVQAGPDWGVVNTTMTALTLGQSFAPWQLNNETGTCMFNAAGGPSGTFANIEYLQAYPVLPGVRYEASVYMGNHRADSHLFLEVRDAAGTPLTYDTGQFAKACLSTEGVGGAYLTGYCRAWLVSAPMPGNAVTVRFGIQVVSRDTTNNPYLFFTRALLAEAKPSQSEPSEWSPAGLTEITGGMIRTDAILARHIAAGEITANEIAVNAVNSNHIAANSIYGDRIFTNSLTADKLNVTSLSAISANLGTVTAGTINGVTINGSTINAGSGNIRLDSTGLNFYSTGGTAVINMNGPIIQRDPGDNAVFVNNRLRTETLGTIYFNVSQINLSQEMYASNLPIGQAVAIHHWTGDNRIFRYSSSRRYKENIRPWTPRDPYAILTLAPQLFDYVGEKTAPAIQTNLLGLMAEDLVPIAPEAVVMDGQGRPEGIRDQALTMYLLAALRAMNDRLTALEKR